VGCMDVNIRFLRVARSVSLGLGAPLQHARGATDAPASVATLKLAHSCKKGEAWHARTLGKELATPIGYGRYDESRS